MRRMNFLYLFSVILSQWFTFGWPMFPPIHEAKKLVEAHPYPHMVMPNFLPQQLIDQLDKDFPVMKEKIKGTYKSLLGEMPEYQTLIQNSAAYRALHEYVNSTAFFEWGMTLYHEFLLKGHLHHNCSVDPRKAFWEYYPESHHKLQQEVRMMTERKQGKNLPAGHNNNRIFTRIDFTHGFNNDYYHGIHQDLPNRIMGILIYLDDMTEESGGAFELYHNGKDLVKKMYPKRNLAMSHMNGWVQGYHAGAKLCSKENPNIQRRFIQIQLAAHQSICRNTFTFATDERAKASSTCPV
jgi:hypothetical protein